LGESDRPDLATLRPSSTEAPFVCLGRPGTAGPVVISVPHAGRCYDEALLRSARVPLAALIKLEDRLVDLLTGPLVAAGHCVVVVRTPRASIDLNRDEREIDPTSVRDWPRGRIATSSVKVRGGLGLIPTHLPSYGSLWREPIAMAEVDRRIVSLHRPYHDVIKHLLRETARIHGAAILLDLHSMPPLTGQTIDGGPSPNIVVGDRFGRSASARLSAIAVELARRNGYHAAINHPYAGGHILERHGKPWLAIHALQIEIDRRLYLDSALDLAGTGLAAMQVFLVSLVRALGDELSRITLRDVTLAAE
jgi:N-formylglutamate amidohydrolase